MTTVVKVGGGVGGSVQCVAGLRRRGTAVAVVHGAGPEISARCRSAGIEPRFLDGQRVTDPDVLAVVAAAVADENAALTADLRGAGIQAVPLDGVLAGIPATDRRLGLVGSVERVDGAAVRVGGATPAFDAVVLAAGAGTAALAAEVGIDLPSALQHHARFTFPLDGGPRPAWIDAPAAGLRTYQHRSGPGRWSVGGTVDAAAVAWAVGPEEATRASRAAVLRFARERLTVVPEVVETLYCTHAPDTGDGITFARSGAVLAVWGENLMKFAPVLGDALAAAAVDGSTPSVRELAEV